MTARTAALRVAAVLAAALGAGIAAAPADAGTYTVYSCRTPDGGPASAEGWSWSATDARLTGFAAACPGGGITLRLLPGHVHDRDANAYMRFTAPSWTTIAGYRMWRTVKLTSAERYFYSATQAFPNASEEWFGPRCGGLSNSCTSVGNPADQSTPANLITGIFPRPLSKYGAYLSCGLVAADAPDCRATTPISAEVTVWRSETDLIDNEAPAFPTTPVGGLLAPGTLTGVQALTTVATDRGGGLAATSLEVDGQVLASQTFSDPNGLCRVPYTQRVPCPATASGTLSIDTTQLPDGPHQLRVLATDAAGNTSAWGPVAIATNNASVVCAPGGPPAGGDLRLTTWIAGEPRAKPSRRKPGRKHGRAAKAGAAEPRAASAAKHPRAARRLRSVTVDVGRGTRLEGQLTGAGGAPVPGAGVCVSTRVADDGPLHPLARVTTDAAGQFSASIAAGTSRQVWAVSRVGAGSVSAKAVMRVRARVTLKPSRTRLRAGTVLRMRGRLTTGPIPRNGVLVNIQARRGRRWQTFRQVRVGRKGRVNVRYRFVGAPGVHRYALRATVPQQSAYHYAPAASHPFRVRVSR